MVSALTSINVVNQHSIRGPGTMSDCLRASKPSGYVTSHLGRLSLLPSVGWKTEHQAGSVIINGDGGCIVS